ncbi:lytic transglycosylase domain-containing protein [Pseudalkalibacillus berkeleyi]|uniref:Transglycosylase SLT domain-containing protein n=1 Tax=Pseudalkalibacillus berkeleyi TaxID=1069813 RepID=A0ABS9GYW4_9BACL|nr:transglycosylase SLT domain-containing protein [Pseudalkalibacillus berkeleyi]MCF6137938.1 transglycosylase SLT domain-containing protein [Pseudalkalibacillus berkeleyi]
MRNKKHLYILFGAFMSLIMALSYTFLQNHTLKQKLEKKKEQTLLLESEKDYQQMVSFYKKERQSKKPQASGFVVRKEAQKLAKQFHKHSDGRFKEEWGQFLVTESLRNDVDPYIVYELLRVETGNKFDPTLVGPKTKYGRAYGMAQFMENTAPWIAEMAGMEYESKEQLFNPYYAIQLSIVYLDYLHAKYDDWDKALTAYHRGMYGLEKYIQKEGHAESWYAKEIQQKAEKQELIAVGDK